MQADTSTSAQHQFRGCGKHVLRALVAFAIICLPKASSHAPAFTSGWALPSRPWVNRGVIDKLCVQRRGAALALHALPAGGFLLRNESFAAYLAEFSPGKDISDTQKGRLRRFVLNCDGAEVAKEIFEVPMDQGGIGSKVWDSGIALSLWLQNNPGCIENKHVLELGSGTGIAGIFASDQASSVTLTDHDGEFAGAANRKGGLLENLERNAVHNAVRENMNVQRLKWGELPLSSAIQQFDTIIGSDLVYDADVVEPLQQTIAACLKSGGHAVIIGPQARTGLKEFRSALVASGAENCIQIQGFQFFELVHQEKQDQVSDAGWQWVAGREKAQLEMFSSPHCRAVCPPEMGMRAWMVPMELMIFRKS